MQSVSSRIWTRVTVSISYDDNHYNTGTSTSNDVTPYTKNTSWLYNRTNKYIEFRSLHKINQIHAKFNI